MPLLKGLVEVATAEVKDVASLQEALTKLLTELRALRPGQSMLVPGGWVGNTAASTVVHVVERGAGGMDAAPDAFVTCHAGQVGV
jgi:hypothetical protein